MNAVIVLLETIHDDARAILDDVDEVVLAADPSTIDADIDLAAVRAVLTRGRGRVDAELLGSLPGVRVVGRCGAGLDNISVETAEALGVGVVHAPGSTTAAVAEHAVMLMLAIARQLTTIAASVERGDWHDRNGHLGTELAGKTLGVIGMGAIGTRVAEIGTCLGMDVACSTSRTETPGVRRLELHELLRTSDVIQVCTSLTPATHGLIGPPEFAAMRHHALLINTARGPIVDHDALADALAADALGGYAADVWIDEPPVDRRLLADERVLVTPHVAALTDATYREICVRTAESVARILRGREPDPTTVRVSAVRT